MMQLGELETDFTKEINEAFKFFDKDGDGEVCASRGLRASRSLRTLSVYCGLDHRRARLLEGLRHLIS